MLKLTNQGHHVKKLNQKGTGHIEALVTLIVVLVIGGSGAYIYKQNDNHKKSSNTQTSTSNSEPKKQSSTKSTDPYNGWQTASFELVQASFKYPKDLQLKHESDLNASPNTPFETYTLIDSDNTMITLTAFHFMGGFTGDEPKVLIDDVVTGLRTNNREFSSVIYKNSNGVYDSAYVLDSTQTKYVAGQSSQIFINSFSAKPKGQNTERTEFSIRISGQKYQTYQTLSEIKSMGAYKDIQKFLGALDIPAAQ